MKINKFNENRKFSEELDEVISNLSYKFDLETEADVGPCYAYYLNKGSDIIEMTFQFLSISENALNILLELTDFVRKYDDVNIYISHTKVDNDMISVDFNVNNISEDAFFAMGKDLEIEMEGNKYNI